MGDLRSFKSNSFHFNLTKIQINFFLFNFYYLKNIINNFKKTLFFFSPLESFDLGVLKEILILSTLDISFSNLSLFIIINFTIYFFFLQAVFKKIDIKILANPLQNFLEKIILFIFTTLKDNLKWKDIIYFSLILSIFQFILFSNLIGLIPYSFSVSGHLIVTFSIAFSIFLGLNIIGFKNHGSYMFSLLLPKGVSIYISILLIFIEFISYNFRVISLSVRLFANIMAGHTLLAVIFGFNYYLIGVSSTSFLIFLLPIILLPCFTLIIALIGLEFGVALIQAYVFTLLCTMYLYDAKYLH